MLNRIVELSLTNRVFVILLACGLGVWGWWAAGATPIDAIPDLSDNQVIVFTEWPGHGAQEVEDQVTYPLTVSLQGLPGVRVVRSQSAFGFSMIYVIFEDRVDQYFARTRVLERLGLVSAQLPEGTTPTLGPDATGVGHVFWYTVESDRHSLRDLRSLQDWFIRYQLNAVPGVAEVASIGGHVQQYQIDVDPNRLRAYDISLGEVVEAVRNSNQNVGGNVLESSGTWSIVRGVGLVQSVDDIAQIVVGAYNGVPVYVRQIGDVRVGDAFRVASPRRAAALVLLAAALLVGGWWLWTRQAGPAAGAAIETVRSGDLVVTLSNPAGELRLGSNRAVIEFRSATTNELVDVGAVRLAASMTMPGMVMTSPITITPTGRPGVYEAAGEFAMAGSWQMTLEWDGPAGRGSAAFEGHVR